MENDNIDVKYVFKRSPEEYTIDLNPYKNYVTQAATFLERSLGLDRKTSITHIKNVLKEADTRNPVIKYKLRKSNGDVTEDEDKLTDYIKAVTEDKELLAPSFTVYNNPSEKKSIHAEFLDINIQKRKVDKKLAFKYKQEGNTNGFLYHNTLQKVRKIFNNSLSGAYASPSTTLFNPSAHYSLTSVTRSVASIGNAISESFIAGNKHLRSPEITMNYVVSIVAEVNMDNIEFVVDKFKLYKPTAKEVMDMLEFSFVNYWRDEAKEKEILEFISKLSDVERCAVMYVNDLHHLKKYNEKFVKDMLSSLSKRVVAGSTDHLTIINNAPEGVMNLVHHICMEDLKGKDASNYAKLDEDTQRILASTVMNILKVYRIYGKLFRTLYTTSIMPISIAYLKDMLRDTIVLSDTDSTCAAYDKWVEWYFGAPKFSSEAVALAASVMTINTQIMDHNIKIFARNMNIPVSDVELLKMKNEFFWPVFVVSNVSKHYFADVWIQEGNVFSKPDLEQKGVHLIASNANQDIVKRLKGMMSDINATITSGQKLEATKYIKLVADLERELIEKIDSGNINIYKSENIKEAAAYKNGKIKSPFINHILWEDVFSGKYGSAGEPQYRVIKVPVITDTKAKMNDFIETIEDSEIKTKLKDFVTKYGKDYIKTFRIPLAVIGSNGIPKELLKIVNKKRIIIDNLNMGYMVLESIGVYRKYDMLLHEMGY